MNRPSKEETMTPLDAQKRPTVTHASSEIVLAGGRPAEPDEPPVVTPDKPLAKELSRTHDADDLRSALVVRLGADRRSALAGRILDAWQPGVFGRVDQAFLAAALVARLQVDGRGEVADRILAHLRDAELKRVDGTLESIMVLRPAASLGPATLMIMLDSRLRADARGGLADRLLALVGSDAQSPRDDEHGEADVTASPRARALGRTLGAETLALALTLRLRGDGREALAGRLMELWVKDITGLIVNPGALATALIASHRDRGCDALADAVASLLGCEGIDRDPESIKQIWLNEIAGPMVEARSLAAALAASFRTSWERSGPADAIILAILGIEREPCTC
jgi:hypothetical protein